MWGWLLRKAIKISKPRKLGPVVTVVHIKTTRIDMDLYGCSSHNSLADSIGIDPDLLNGTTWYCRRCYNMLRQVSPLQLQTSFFPLGKSLAHLGAKTDPTLW
jgi:hypothetical protein